MKKTLIAILATTGIAATNASTLLVTFDNCAQSTVDGIMVNVDNTLVEGDLISIKRTDNQNDVSLQTSGTAGEDANIITPNVNVGNTSPWVADFTFTNVNKALTSLESIDLDFVLFNNTGIYQTSTAVWSGTLTFTAHITDESGTDLGSFTYSVPTDAEGKFHGQGSTPFEGTLIGDSIDLTDVSTINVKLETSKTFTTGTFVGLKNMGLTGTDNVPEPATASLSLLGLAALMIRRRR